MLAAERARPLFEGIAARYDRPAQILSFGGYGRWRRALVEAMAPAPGDRVLDVATGTGLIARDLTARYGCAVVGVDLTEAMLRHDARGDVRGPAACADARRLPFADDTFDALTFSYLLRYVDDPAATLAELARVVRPGGAVGCVEFGVPSGRITGLGWRAYARGVFPVACRRLGGGWADVGAFLPGSIQAWAHDWPEERQRQAWEGAGMRVRTVRRMMLGTGVVTVGVRDG